MRTLEQIRSRLLENLSYTLRRPSTMVYPARAVEFYILDLLSNICFIDEREDELNQALDNLAQKEMSTNTGVFGAFHQGFSYERIEINRLYHEVTSIYAEIAWRLGYLTIDRCLSNAEWRILRQGLRAKCQARDWYQSEGNCV